MASGDQPDGLADDFFAQILSVPSSYAAAGNDSASSARSYGMGGDSSNLARNPMLQLGSGSSGGGGSGFGGGGDGGEFRGLRFPLGLNLQQHQQGPVNSSSSSSINEGEPVRLTSMFPTFGQLQPPLPIRPLRPPQLHQPFQAQPSNGAVASPPNPPPSMRPRPRARRGQATDPHSIAERLRRERIAERVRALQELVPTANKTDRAAMLDDIVDYVKFLRLQVKVLSMSRLGGAGAVAQLVSDVSLLSLEGELGGGMEGGSNQQGWCEDGTEEEVARLMMEEDTGAAMQFLQSKGLCIMPLSLATTIFRARDSSGSIKPEQP